MNHQPDTQLGPSRNATPFYLMPRCPCVIAPLPSPAPIITPTPLLPQFLIDHHTPPPDPFMARDLDDDPRFYLPSRFLEDDDDPPKVAVALSPQSTLRDHMAGWSTSSSDGASQESSPPSPLDREDPWELALQMVSEQNVEQTPKTEPKKQRKAWGAGATGGGAAGTPLGLSASAWPPLRSVPTQPQASSGMRAVFMQHKEPSGTGVFLPRNAKVEPGPRPKSACSSVLLPAKVVQALNMHRRLAGRTGLDHDAVFMHNVALLQSRGLLPRVSPMRTAAVVEEAMAGEDIGLPAEWTY